MKRRTSRIAILLPLALVGQLSASARAEDSSDGIVQGHVRGEIEVESRRDGTPVVESGWPQLVEDTYVGPVFHDLDDDGTLDVIVPAGFSLHVFDHEGSVRSGWPQSSGLASLPAAVGDLDGNGSPDIAVTGAFHGAHLRVLTAGGTMLPGFPVGLPYQDDLTCSGPVFADIDGDQELDVGAASELGISFFHADGSPVEGWPYTWSSGAGLLTPQWCAPAVGDLAPARLRPRGWAGSPRSPWSRRP